MKLHVRTFFYFIASLLTLCVTRAYARSEAIEAHLIFNGGERPLRVTTVFSPPLQKSIPLLLEKTKLALTLAQQRIGLPLVEDFYIFFDSQPDDSNGLTTVIPNNRIIVQTEAPMIDESIGLSKDYLTETILHELGHMTAMQRASGFFAFFDKIFGNASRPIGLWPRWIHEGLAVWTESSLGGRPNSGYIDLDVRKYAEYVGRKHKDPFDNSELDGQFKYRRLEPGDMPYHFGYLLLDEWSRENPNPDAIKDFIQKSSQSLGLSYRESFRTQGEDLDSLYADAKKKWAATPLAEVTKADRDARQVIADSDYIAGPEANENAVTWIEAPFRTDNRFLKARLSDGKTLTVHWREKYDYPLQAFLTKDGKWLLLTRHYDENPAYVPSRVVTLLSPDGDRICAVRTPPRLREIDFRRDHLAWVRSEESGVAIAERARVNDDCTVSDVVELARGRTAFERLSSPRLDDEKGEKLTYSRSVGTDSYREFAVTADGELSTASVPLSQPIALSPALCGYGADACYLLNQFNKIYWGPVLSGKFDGEWRTHAVALRTGSTKSVPVPGTDLIAVKEEFWEYDTLTLIPAKQFAQAAAEVVQSPGLTSPPEAAHEPTPTEAYSPWPSIWPHFWVPTLASSSPGGYIAMGQTFYEDLTQSWAGSTAVGYDSAVRRPFAVTDLTRQKLEWGPVSSLDMQGFYQPIYNFYASPGQTPAQNRWGASVSLGLTKLFSNGWLLALSPGAQYLQAADASNLSGFKFLIPSLTAVLKSAYGLSPSTLRQTWDLQDAGFYLSQETGEVKRPFFVNQASFNFPIWKTSMRTTVEYASTSSANFPAIEFLWGGLPEVSTPSSTYEYLSRGFPAITIPAQNLLRTAAEWQFNITRPEISLSWNRARLRSLESRWIVESVSFSQFTFNGQTPYFKLGRQYFTSAGTMLDFWSSALQYVDFVASAGVFRGFGIYGETQYSVVLQGWFDI